LEDGSETLWIAKVKENCKAEEAAEDMLIAGEEIEKGFIVITGKWMVQWGTSGNRYMMARDDAEERLFNLNHVPGRPRHQS